MAKSKSKTKSSKKSSKVSKLPPFLKIFTVVPVLLALAIFVIGFFPIKYPVINSYIFSQLQLSGINLKKADQIYVTLWKGVSLHGLTISQKIDQNWKIKCYLKNVSLECNVIKTFIRWKQFKKKYLPDSKKVAGSLNLTDSLDVCISRINDVFDKCGGVNICGKLSLTKNDSSMFSMRDFDAKIILKDNSGALRMVCKSDSSNLFKNGLGDMRCSLSYKNGNVYISDWNTKFNDGIIRVVGGVNTKKMRLNQLHVVGSNLNISEVCNQYLKNGKINCVVDMKLKLGSSALNFDSLNVDGIIKSSVLEISDLPLQKTFSQLMYTDKLMQLSFTDFETTFKNKPDSKKYDMSVKGTGLQLNFKSNGWLSLDGAWEQHIEGIINESFAKELPRIVVGTLPRKSSGRFFKGRLYGTFMEPKIELDKEILQHAVRNIFTNIKLNIREKKSKR